MIKYFFKRYSSRKIVLFIGDSLCIIIAILIALSFTFNVNTIKFVNPFSNLLKIILYISVSFVTLFAFRYLSLYKERTYFSGTNSIVAISKGLLVSAVLLIIITFFLKYEDFSGNSRFSLLIYLLSGFIFIFGYRFTFIKIFRGTKSSEIFNRNILAIGAGESGEIFAKEIKNISSYLNLIGFIDDDSEKIGKEIDGVKIIGKLKDIEQIVEENSIDEIFITITAITYEKLMRIIEITKPTKCQINLLSPHFGIVEKKFDSKEFKDLRSVPINAPLTSIYSIFVKRVLDIIFAVILLIIFLPIFAIFIFFIKITSKGPAFYKTNVIGKKGRKFEWYKFRTMKHNNKFDVHKNHLKNIIKNNKSIEKIKNDDRITAVGKFLRKFSLDELPQLFNVLKGDMSLIGPRPCFPYEYEMMDDWHKRRTQVIPGMSGLWQILGRNKKDVTFNDSLILDLYYVDNISFWLDLKIIIRTFPVVVFGRGGV